MTTFNRNETISRQIIDVILNAFDYDYSNGIVEGTNNLIKQINELKKKVTND